MDKEFDFDVWFDQFWAFWRGLDDLHAGYPGTKKEALDVCKKLKPEELHDIESKTRELVRWDRTQKKNGVRVDRYKHLCRWIKHGAYERYVGSYAKQDKKSAPTSEKWAEYLKRMDAEQLEKSLAWCEEKGIIIRGKTTRSQMHENCMRYMADQGLAPAWVHRRVNEMDKNASANRL